MCNKKLAIFVTYTESVPKMSQSSRQWLCSGTSILEFTSLNSMGTIDHLATSRLRSSSRTICPALALDMSSYCIGDRSCITVQVVVKHKYLWVIQYFHRNECMPLKQGAESTNWLAQSCQNLHLVCVLGIQNKCLKCKLVWIMKAYHMVLVPHLSAGPRTTYLSARPNFTSGGHDFEISHYKPTCRGRVSSGPVALQLLVQSILSSGSITAHRSLSRQLERCCKL